MIYSRLASRFFEFKNSSQYALLVQLFPGVVALYESNRILRRLPLVEIVEYQALLAAEVVLRQATQTGEQKLLADVDQQMLYAIAIVRVRLGHLLQRLVPLRSLLDDFEDLLLSSLLSSSAKRRLNSTRLCSMNALVRRSSWYFFKWNQNMPGCGE